MREVIYWLLAWGVQNVACQLASVYADRNKHCVLPDQLSSQLVHQQTDNYINTTLKVVVNNLLY